MIAIRPEIPDDWDAVRRVIVDAFTHCEFGHHGEAELVDRLRENCDESVSLVATDGDEVVGHIFFSPVSIRTSAGETRGMGLAPMAVAPAHQGAGVGAALVHAGLDRLAAAGCPTVVVLGHPDYYPRFGFLPAAHCEISHGFTEIPQEVFFVKMLHDRTPSSFVDGRAIYRTEFGEQDDGT